MNQQLLPMWPIWWREIALAMGILFMLALVAHIFRPLAKAVAEIGK